MSAMVFWIAAALLTLVACLAILAPFARAHQPAEPADAHDLEVYRDQLDEVGRDKERGLISPSEAEQVRTEIGRRILQAARDRRARPGGARPAQLAAMAAVLAVPLVSWGIYGATGSPDMPGQPLAERLARNPAESTIDELVARAERHLAANPTDARGWDVLAPIYMRQSRFADAANAYRNAIRLSGATAEREAGHGEALAAAAKGLVTAEAQAAFERALALDPGDPRARFYLATAYAQEGRAEDAVREYRRVAEAAPETTPWHGSALAAIAALETARPGPTAADVASAEAMTEADRGAMIETMVASLDERLRANPADAEGWRRLIRSYVVLGRMDDARSALQRAVAGLGADQSAAGEVREFARSLGVSVEAAR
jgi:cytochrome c-type biogenesis protein CcmH